MKLWILVLCAVAAGVTAQSDEADALDWNEDYDDEWFRTQLEKLGIYNDEQIDIQQDSAAIDGILEKDQKEIDTQVEKEIKKFQESEDDYDKIDDYQFEDNRSAQSENLGDGKNAEPIHDTDDGNNQDMLSLSASEDDYDDYALKPEDDFEHLPENEDLEPEPKFSKDDDTAPLESFKSSEEIKRILEEAQAIINEEEQKPNDFANNEVKQENDDISGIIRETKDILDDESQEPNDFDAGESNENVENSKTLDNIFEKEVDDNLSDNMVDKDEETVDKVYEDLNGDLDKLFETLDKLTKSVEKEEDQNVKPDDVDYAVHSDENLDSKPDYENVFDSNLSDIFAENALGSDNLKDPPVEPEVGFNETNDEVVKDTSIEEVEKLAGQILEALPYLDDALPSEDKEDEKSMKSISVNKLSNDQLNQLMKDFPIQHNDAFEIQPLEDNHIVNEIELEYGETKVIESENYPSGYPTNRIVDWIITGKGQGIELNVTDFDVNSALGDYLMVKPGQLDDSGDEGIIFSYHLNEPRAYRFVDVDRIFIRFDSKQGMSFLRGFNLTLKMIAPLPQDPMPEPEPEPLLPEPRHTLTVVLGGPTLLKFQEIRQDFRLFIADMATMYINANDIEPGMNTTTEITQIISASSCNMHWPGYQHCSQVKFSVPLVYEGGNEEPRLNENDLQTMWQTYVGMDPFAARLRQMGIEEFSVPNDGGVLTVWLVVGLGVVVSAAMLAFALWRYSCMEDYSRMPAFSDTDSLNEKRSSALYPTPHQMLPPLYPENDYDATRVDMGYTNRSYTRTDMYDLESDEDVVVTRDRNASIQPRDIYSV